jgi:phage terminase small subunit
VAITRKQQKFVNEYMADLNATQAAIRAGYSEKTAYSIGQRLLKNVEIRDEVERIMASSRMSPADITKRLELMADGTIPTKIVKTPSRTYGKPTIREEYDTKGATESMGKIYALFIDRSQVEDISHLNITDDEDPEPDPPGAAS